MDVRVNNGGGTQKGEPAAEEKVRFQKDIIFVANSKMYINEKGYIQKLLELLYKTGYYKDNESYFTRKG